MAFFQENIEWAIGFLIVTILCIAAMLWRNHAAKTDTVLHSEMDTIKNSVSIETNIPLSHKDAKSASPLGNTGDEDPGAALESLVTDIDRDDH